MTPGAGNRAFALNPIGNLKKTARNISRCALALFLLATTQAAGNIVVISAQDNPFMAIPSQDGSAIFVSVTRQQGGNGVLIVHRQGDGFQLGQFLPIEGEPHGMALTPDGKILLVASSDRYAALDAAAAARDEKTQIAYFQDPSVEGAIEAATTIDGQYAFFSDENSDSVDMMKIGRTPEGLPTLTRAGRLQTDHAPVGMAVSPDGAYLYVTSEVAAGRPRTCGRRPLGTLTVYDVARASVEPRHAMISSAEAGCAPVRVAVSPDGKTIWVTERGDDNLAAFDAAALRLDPAHAQRASVRVGTAPVGLVLVKNGALALVANSARFDQQRNSTVSVIDTAKALAGQSANVTTYPTGMFPRELREAPQHDVVYLTNYGGGTVEVLSIPH